MNRKRLFVTADFWLVVGLFSLFGAGCWAILIAGICHLIFGLEGVAANLFIGVPLFIVLFVWLICSSPKYLRKAGILGDYPDKLGPWFKS